MRHLEFIVFAILIFSPIDSFCISPDRPDIFIQSGTEVTLTDIFPVIMADGTKPTLYVYELHVQSGAKIYIPSDIHLNSKKMVLNPNSQLYTLGHSLHIKSDEFLAAFSNGFGIIDTRSRDKAKTGENRTHIPEPKPALIPPNAYKNEDLKIPETGNVGQSGMPGSDGAHAGDLTIETPKFFGGNFVLSGSEGGRGGDGGIGGQGGKGLESSDRFGYHSFNDWPCGMNVHPNLGELMTGGVGGQGGLAGVGGLGGNGGNLVISCDEFKAISGENFNAAVAGGSGGISGNPGFGGPGGDGGTVMRDVTQKVEHGQPGRMGPLGFSGHTGKDGKSGQVQILNGQTYEMEE